MAFTDLIQSVNITPLADGEAELLDRAPAEAESGWDSMRDRWLLRNDSAGMDPDAAIAASFSRGSQIAGKNMWIVSRSGRCRAWGLFEIEVVSMGLLSDRGDRVRYDAGANGTQGRNIVVPGSGLQPNVPGSGLQPNVAAQESQVTCDIEYIVIGPTPGGGTFFTEDVGEAQTPPAPWTPPVKESIWSFLTEYTFHYPYGWVLMGSGAENLPGVTNVWLVRDRYQYIYQISP